MRTFVEAIQYKRNLDLMEQFLLEYAKKGYCPIKFVEWIARNEFDSDNFLNENFLAEMETVADPITAAKRAMASLNQYSRNSASRVGRLMNDPKFGATIIALMKNIEQSITRSETTNYAEKIVFRLLENNINPNLFLEWYCEDGFEFEFNENLWNRFSSWLGRVTGYTNYANTKNLQSTDALINDLTFYLNSNPPEEIQNQVQVVLDRLNIAKTKLVAPENNTTKNTSPENVLNNPIAPIDHTKNTASLSNNPYSENKFFSDKEFFESITGKNKKSNWFAF